MSNLPTLPVTHLGARQLALPLGILAFGIVLAFAVLALVLGVQPEIWTRLFGCTGLKLAMGFASFVAGFAWLTHSWRPGAAKPTDYVLPWAVLAIIMVAGLLQARSEIGGAGAMVEIVLLSVPFLIGFTWLTRLQAPTDLCSTSNAIGFTAGGGAVMLYALHCPLQEETTVLLWYGAAIAATTLISRAVLCRFLKW